MQSFFVVVPFLRRKKSDSLSIVPPAPSNRPMGVKCMGCFQLEKKQGLLINHCFHSYPHISGLFQCLFKYTDSGFWSGQYCSHVHTKRLALSCSTIKGKSLMQSYSQEIFDAQKHLRSPHARMQWNGRSSWGCLTDWQLLTEAEEAGGCRESNKL